MANEQPPAATAGTRTVAGPCHAGARQAASIWEIAIKLALGRLEVNAGVDFVAEIAANHFTPLSITPVHAWHAGSLPHYHDDPFDRLLIVQAQLEGLSIVTHDGAFESFR